MTVAAGLLRSISPNGSSISSLPSDISPGACGNWCALTQPWPLASVRWCPLSDERGPLPIERRKDILAKLLSRPNQGIAFNQHYTCDGAVIYKHACTFGCEGIVSKRLGSPYRSGRSDHWLKIKSPMGGRGLGPLAEGSVTHRRPSTCSRITPPSSRPSVVPGTNQVRSRKTAHPRRGFSPAMHL
jgi:hypothetical protein